MGLLTRHCFCPLLQIGDCYVAVVGLPSKFIGTRLFAAASRMISDSGLFPFLARLERRREHAVVMARFASDCLAKSSVVFNAMTDRLGNDTQNLCLRIGLHSGPVTAGVLRGEKGRFQIFGDTGKASSGGVFANLRALL